MAAEQCWIILPECVPHGACAHADKPLCIKEESTRNYSVEIRPEVQSHISFMGARRITWCYSGWVKHFWETPAANSRPHVVTSALSPSPPRISAEMLWCDIHTLLSRSSVEVLFSWTAQLLKAFWLLSEEVRRRRERKAAAPLLLAVTLVSSQQVYGCCLVTGKVATENYLLLSTSSQKKNTSACSDAEQLKKQLFTFGNMLPSCWNN